MAGTLSFNKFASIGGTQITDLKNAGLSAGQATVEDNYMSDDLWERSVNGIQNWSVTLEFNNSSAMEALIWDFFANPGAKTVIVKPLDAAVSASNPSYTGSVLLDGSVDFLAGNRGEIKTLSVTLKGSGALVRATS